MKSIREFLLYQPIVFGWACLAWWRWRKLTIVTTLSATIGLPLGMLAHRYLITRWPHLEALMGIPETRFWFCVAYVFIPGVIIAVGWLLVFVIVAPSRLFVLQKNAIRRRDDRIRTILRELRSERNIGIDYEETAHRVKTKHGYRYRVLVTNCSDVDLESVYAKVIKIQPMEQIKKRRGKVATLHGCYLTPSDRELATGEMNHLFPLTAKGGNHLIDVIHLYEKGSMFVLVTKQSARRIEAGQYEITIQVESEKTRKVYGVETFYFNRTPKGACVFKKQKRKQSD